MLWLGLSVTQAIRSEPQLYPAKAAHLTIFYVLLTEMPTCVICGNTTGYRRPLTIV